MNRPRTDAELTDAAFADPELSESELDAALDATEAGLAESLAHILRPPADLQSRTASNVREGLLARSTLDTGVGLLGVGVHTLALLFTPTASEDLA